MPDATMSQSLSKPTALGICLEGYEYPYPVQFFQVSSDLQRFSMAYMDVPPTGDANGKTVVLFHGKAFGCYYFENVIEALTGAGYRVVAPDQLGWASHRNPTFTTASRYWPPTRRHCSITSGSSASQSWVTRREA